MMPSPNYMLQDIGGSMLAFILYFVIFMIPGYIIGWSFNIFNFRQRFNAVQCLIGIALSNAISPILMFLCARFVSIRFAIAISFCFLVIWFWIVLGQFQKRSSSRTNLAGMERYQKIAIIISIAWVLFSILRLVDIQSGQRLYFSVVSYDLTTRVSVVDAITRTGVPPINPGYFPGHPSQLTFLYYFWYILGSMVDIIGGSWVSPYQAMIASIAWAGFIALATTAVYIRLRDNPSKGNPRKLSLIASQLFLISGLDFIPIVSQLVYLRLAFGKIFTNGQIEGWNVPIISWMNAVAWVPHHAAAVFACMIGMLAFSEAIKGKLQTPVAAVIAGLAFASAIGLSVWVPFVFAIFWGIWILILIFQKKTRKFAMAMLLSGFIALIAISPFVIDILRSGGSGNGSLPIAFYVRPFAASLLFNFATKTELYIFNFLVLPLNYLFELGFTFLTAILWLRRNLKSGQTVNHLFVGETILLSVVAVFLAFFHSTIIKINDLGIRPWLLGQFVLLIWAIDIIAPWFENNGLIRLSQFRPLPNSRKFVGLFQIFFIIGFLTTLLEVVAVRFVPILIDQNIIGLPNDLSPDIHLGERTYFARQTYDYIHEKLAENSVIQNNPAHELDRPGGLYGNHQMIIADRTVYGVPQDEVDRLKEGVEQIFQTQDNISWKTIDTLCRQYFINYIVVGDTDPLWASTTALSMQRTPIFKNPYYIVFGCGG